MSNIHSSQSHATAVQSWKQRLRAGALVDALDDTGRWGRARVVQLDRDWGKVQVKFEGARGGEQWVPLATGDRLRPPGEMTVGFTAQASHGSAAAAAHARDAAELRREAALLWLLALVLLLLAQWQTTADTRYFVFCGGAAAVVCWPWYGALGRTLRSVSENWKSDMSAADVTMATSLWQKLLVGLLPNRLKSSVGPLFQHWWLKRGARVDFRSRSGEWIKAEVVKFPFPWVAAELRFASGVHNRPTQEWITLAEGRIMPPGQLTGQLTDRNMNMGHRNELSGVFNSRLLDSATRQRHPDPLGMTPTSSRRDGLPDSGGYGIPASPGFSGMLGTPGGMGSPMMGGGGGMNSPVSPTMTGGTGGFGTSPFRAAAASSSPFASSGVGGGMNSSFGGMDGLASPISASASPFGGMGRVSSPFGAGAAGAFAPPRGSMFADISNMSELQEYCEDNPLPGAYAHRTGGGGGGDGGGGGSTPGRFRSPSPTPRSSGGGGGIGGGGGGGGGSVSLSGVSGASWGGVHPLHDHHTETVRPYRAGQQMTQSEAAGEKHDDGQTDHTFESPEELLQRLAQQYPSYCPSGYPSPWTQSPGEDLLRWSWHMQQWVEAHIIDFVGRTLYENEFLTLAGVRGDGKASAGHHIPKAKALLGKDVRARALDIEALFTRDPLLAQNGASLSDQTIHQLMRQAQIGTGGGNGMLGGHGAVAGGQGFAHGIMGGVMGGFGAGIPGLGARSGGGRNGIGSNTDDERTLLDYIKTRLDSPDILAHLKMGMPGSAGRIGELQRQQQFIDAHELSNSKKPRSVYIVQRLRTLALCSNVWGQREAGSYCWNGGFYENQRWVLPNAPGGVSKFPSDAEIILELFLSPFAVQPLDNEHASSGRHLVTASGSRGGVIEQLRKRELAAAGHGSGHDGKGALLAEHASNGLRLSVIAPRHSANLAMPLWRLPPGRTNLPAALSLFVYYMHYIDPPVAHGSSAIESQILAVEALQRRGVGTSWGSLCRSLFQAGQRDGRADGFAAPLSDSELREMLAQRESARHTGDAAQAARLLDTLRVHGIILDDQASRWTASDGRAGAYPPASSGHGGRSGWGAGAAAAAAAAAAGVGGALHPSAGSMSGNNRGYFSVPVPSSGGGGGGGGDAPPLESLQQGGAAAGRYGLRSRKGRFGD